MLEPESFFIGMVSGAIVVSVFYAFKNRSLKNKADILEENLRYIRHMYQNKC
jgi:hypothetical protein